MENKVTILGARGSIPVSGRPYLHYGGATTCILVELGDETIVVDAGNGILNLPRETLELPELTLLLTHPHADHLLGLPMCPYLFRKGATLHLYAATLEGMTAEEQVRRLFSAPIWPVGPELLPGELCFHTLGEKQRFGGVQVETMQGHHPGGVSLLRLTGGGRSVVITTDLTITEEEEPALAAFARGCDLFLCDGQYSREEWKTRSGFGHSTWAAAVSLARDAEVKEARIIHHDPGHTDEFLDAAAPELRRVHPKCSFAWEGEVIRL